MLLVSMICKVFYLLAISSALIHAFPAIFLNFTDSNFPRQFVQQPIQPSPTTSNGEHLLPHPYPQISDHEATTTLLYSIFTTDFASKTTNAEDDDLSSATTDSNDEDSTIAPFINPNVSGFPIKPPGTFPLNPLPTAGGETPLKPKRPSISSTLLSHYPQQHVYGAVGPFPEKIQQQQEVVPVIGGGVGAVVSLLQILNPLNLFKPVTDTFQNIGNILSHPNYGPGAVLFRPVQFWSAVNAAGNPTLAPFRKVPSNVVVTSDSREK